MLSLGLKALADPFLVCFTADLSPASPLKPLLSPCYPPGGTGPSLPGVHTICITFLTASLPLFHVHLGAYLLRQAMYPLRQDLLYPAMSLPHFDRYLMHACRLHLYSQTYTYTYDPSVSGSEMLSLNMLILELNTFKKHKSSKQGG